MAADPVSWRGIIYGTPVVASDGARVGVVREVLGSDAEDVFHGIRVGVDGARRDVMVAADDVTDLRSDALGVGLSAAEVRALPAFDEASTYHLASVGWLRHHLGWRRDSTGDEEAG